MQIHGAHPDPIRHTQELFRSVGFAHIARASQADYEAHLLENKRFLVISSPALVEVANLRFFDNPEPRRVIGQGPNGEEITMGGGRVFNWSNRMGRIHPNFPLDETVLRSIASEGPNQGFPIGIVTEEAHRVEQVRALGTSRKADFCEHITLPNGDEIRLYAGTRHLPDLTDLVMPDPRRN
ncbi:MAG: hypothetical protein KDD70_16745 [Bdellovibrionales bacterium]|nr:hypothetical protein [Bdellovibrionales bacterium]